MPKGSARSERSIAAVRDELEQEWTRRDEAVASAVARAKDQIVPLKGTTAA
jgi:hypothetical protein